MQDEVYKLQKPDGTYGYYTPKDGQWVETQAPVEQAPHASEIQKRGMDSFLANDGTLIPRFTVDKGGPPLETGFKLGANAIAQALDVVPASIGGVIGALGTAKDAAKGLMEAQSPADLYNTGNQIGSGIVNQALKDRFTWEGFSQNPLTLPLDVASIASPFLKGTSVPKGLAGLSEKLKSSTVRRYLGDALNENFKIPEFGLNNVTAQGVPQTSTVQDIMNTSKQFNMHPPTVGQLTGNPHAIRAELMNPGLTDVLESQNKGVATGLQHFLEQPSLNGTNNQINLAMDTSQATGIIRNQIVKGVKAEKAFLNNRLEQTLTDMGKVFNRGSSTPTTFTDNSSLLAEVDNVLESAKKMRKLPPELQQKVTELRSLRKLYNSDQAALSNIESSRLMQNISRSTNTLDPRAPKPTYVNPDADYTKMIDQAFKSPEQFQRFVQFPGVGKENAAQLLIYKIANEARVPGTQYFSPRAIYEGLTDKNNASMLKRVLDPKQRVGLQAFAHTLSKLDRYTPTQAANMALSLGAREDAAIINVGGSIVPKLLGGNVAQMRAGYGLMQGTYLEIKGKYLGRLLLHDPWLVNSIAQTPKNAPSLPGKLRQLVKTMGELHIPTIFNVNGEDVEIPPVESEVPVN